jgi:hypothetical protein
MFDASLRETLGFLCVGSVHNCIASLQIEPFSAQLAAKGTFGASTL